MAGPSIGLRGAGVPFNFNASRRDRFAKAKSRMTNWAEYNEALRLRGDLAVCFDEDAVFGRCVILGPVYLNVEVRP